jgi:hypothetical protein
LGDWILDVGSWMLNIRRSMFDIRRSMFAKPLPVGVLVTTRAPEEQKESRIPDHVSSPTRLPARAGSPDIVWHSLLCPWTLSIADYGEDNGGGQRGRNRGADARARSLTEGEEPRRRGGRGGTRSCWGDRGGEPRIWRIGLWKTGEVEGTAEVGEGRGVAGEVEEGNHVGLEEGGKAPSTLSLDFAS